MSNDELDFEPPVPEKDQKFCKKCLAWKPLTDFFKRGGKSKYYAGYCKQCHSQPFRYEAICCPNCKAKIAFFGIDSAGNIVKQKSEILAKLKKQAKEQLSAKSIKKEKAALAEAKASKNLKDIL